MSRALGDSFAVSRCLPVLGHVLILQGHLPQARERLEEGRRISHHLGLWADHTIALRHLAGAAVDQGKLDEAAPLVVEALSVAGALGHAVPIAAALEAAAALAAGNQQAGRALRLAGAATAVRGAAGVRIPTMWEPELNRWLEPARRALSDERRRTLWAEGVAMTMQQAILDAMNACNGLNGTASIPVEP
jgi:hypothetical protein